MKGSITEEIKRLRSIAEIGLLYCKNEYDRQRYQELHEVSFQLMSRISGYDIGVLKERLPLSSDYPTAKMDIRGLLLSEDNKLLLVKESTDGKWSLPGGWGDIGYSPAEVIIKEFKEETGLDVMPERLLAVFDKKMHAHPPQPFYVYKLVFFCKAIGGQISPDFEVLEVQYFDISQLPELSEDRILKSQLQLLYKKIIDNDTLAYFD